MTTMYYFYNINAIGGIETFFYQLGKMFNSRDLTIVYRIGDQKQIDRLKQYVKVHQYIPGEIIRCKQALFNFNLDIIDLVEAEEYTLVIHGDYKDMKERGQLLGIPDHPKITRRIAVSKLAAQTFEEVTGYKCEVCYNPFTPLKTERPLIFVAATRLSVEKGWDRLKKSIIRLDLRNINYLFFIFTNSPQEYVSDNVYFLPPRLDFERIIKMADFLWQTSDNEGFCYSVIEALTHGVPVVVTPCPVFKELGLNKKNSITLEFDCSNIDQVIDDILFKKFEFKYKPPKTNWGNVLLKSKRKDPINYLVEATGEYLDRYMIDSELNKIPKEGEQWITNEERARMLESKGYINIIKEVKNEKINNNNSRI